jgi:hypothetical protein
VVSPPVVVLLKEVIVISSNFVRFTQQLTWTDGDVTIHKGGIMSGKPLITADMKMKLTKADYMMNYA